jgi:hypothetical protein
MKWENDTIRKDLHHYYSQADLQHQEQNHLDLCPPCHLQPLVPPAVYLEEQLLHQGQEHHPPEQLALHLPQHEQEPLLDKTC